MFEVLAKDIKELSKNLPRKPKVAKNSEKEDIKITQDVQIAQAIAKEAISQYSGNGLNVNIVNIQLSNLNKPIENQQEIDTEEPPNSPMIEAKKPIVIPAILKNDEELYHSLKMIIEHIPSPRKTNLIRMIYEIAYKKFDTTTEMAKWLGVERSALYHWFKKMGVLPPDTLREMGVNKNKWQEAHLSINKR